jgi:DNA repair exonuclease SbcCD ATPase subunit
MKQGLEQMPSQTTETRLERIEDKLDQLTDAMVALARAEEKIGTLQEHHNNQFERINRLSGKIDEIERIVLDNHRTVTVLNKLFWVAVVAAAGAVGTNIYM